MSFLWGARPLWVLIKYWKFPFFWHLPCDYQRLSDDKECLRKVFCCLSVQYIIVYVRSYCRAQGTIFSILGWTIIEKKMSKMLYMCVTGSFCCTVVITTLQLYASIKNKVKRIEIPQNTVSLQNGPYTTLTVVGSLFQISSTSAFRSA